MLRWVKSPALLGQVTCATALLNGLNLAKRVEWFEPGGARARFVLPGCTLLVGSWVVALFGLGPGIALGGSSGVAICFDFFRCVCNYSFDWHDASKFMVGDSAGTGRCYGSSLMRPGG